MKLYPNLLKAASDCLATIFFEDKKADHAIVQVLSSNKSWGARDRNFLADLIYHVVRYKLKWMHIASIDQLKDHTDIKALMAVALLDKGHEKETLKTFFDFEINDAPIEHIYVAESFPAWLAHVLAEELGQPKAEEMMQQLNGPTALVLRINSLKASSEKVIVELDKANINHTFLDPETILVHQKWAVKNSDLYKNGWVEIQDGSSQQLARFCDPAQHSKVIDACSGAGGKTLHLAALMHNKGQIAAWDISQRKLDELSLRAKRAGVKILSECSLVDDASLEKHSSSADLVLIDAPCSGLGTIKRDPDLKWKLTIEKLNAIRLLQTQILEKYALMAKKGGYVVYATCSILPSENRDQVAYFLSQNPSFSLIEERSIFPDQLGFDGFYMAKLKRN